MWFTSRSEPKIEPGALDLVLAHLHVAARIAVAHVQRDLPVRETSGVLRVRDPARQGRDRRDQTQDSRVAKIRKAVRRRMCAAHWRGLSPGCAMRAGARTV